MVLHPPPRPQLGYAVGHPQDEGIRTVTIAGKEDPVPGLCLLQGGHQPHHPRGNPGGAYTHEEGSAVLKLRRLESGLSRHPPVTPHIRRQVQNQLGEVLGGQVTFLHQPGDGLGKDRGVALIQHHAVLPGTHEGIGAGPPQPGKLIGDGVAALNGDDEVILPQKQGCRPIAEHLLQHAGRPRQAAIRGRHQHLRERTSLDGIPGPGHPRRPRPQRVGHVRGAHIPAQVQGQGHYRRALLLSIRGGGGGEDKPLHRPGIGICQAVDGRLDRHGQAIFIVVGHTPLPRYGKAAPGPEELLPAQPVPGYVSTI